MKYYYNKETKEYTGTNEENPDFFSYTEVKPIPYNKELETLIFNEEENKWEIKEPDIIEEEEVLTLEMIEKEITILSRFDDRTEEEEERYQYLLEEEKRLYRRMRALKNI